MKKKILTGVFALVILTTAGWGLNKSMNSEVELTDLALADVEALASSGENGCTTTPGANTGVCKANINGGYNCVGSSWHERNDCSGD